MNWDSCVILFILSIFGIRDLIAAFGNLPRDKWYSNFLYGNYDKNLVSQILKEWGFPDDINHRIRKNIKNTLKEMERQGINNRNSLKTLLHILTKYIINFPEGISYGQSKQSKYYIDTMEASTNDEYLAKMAFLMVRLICEKTKKVDIVFVNKMGNVFLAKAVADLLKAKLVIVKSTNDESRAKYITTGDVISKELYQTNFEGAWDLFEGKKKHCIVVDCNTSSGNQLIQTIKDINMAKTKCGIKVHDIKHVFVLYIVDDESYQIDEMFKDVGCELHRFVDLNEYYKEKIFEIHGDYDFDKINIYNKNYSDDLSNLIGELENNNKIKNK